MDKAVRRIALVRLDGVGVPNDTQGVRNGLDADVLLEPVIVAVLGDNAPGTNPTSDGTISTNRIYIACPALVFDVADKAVEYLGGLLVGLTVDGPDLDGWLIEVGGGNASY